MDVLEERPFSLKQPLASLFSNFVVVLFVINILHNHSLFSIGAYRLEMCLHPLSPMLFPPKLIATYTKMDCIKFWPLPFGQILTSYVHDVISI